MAHSTISELYKTVQKPVLFNGFHKEYQPLDEAEHDTLPPERLKVQITAAEAIISFQKATSELMQITARKDYTNRTAHSDVVIDGRTLVSAAPVGFLLFLEKTLT